MFDQATFPSLLCASQCRLEDDTGYLGHVCPMVLLQRRLIDGEVVGHAGVGRGLRNERCDLDVAGLKLPRVVAEGTEHSGAADGADREFRLRFELHLVVPLQRLW